MDSVTVLNVVLIGGTLAMGIYGAYRGGIHQIGSVAAFLLAFFVARVVGGSVAEAVKCPSMVCYAVIFATVFVATTVATRILRLTVKLLLMGPIDRLLGMLIGAAKWVLICSFVLNLAIFAGLHGAALSTPFAKWVVAFLPHLFGIAIPLN